MKKTEAIEFVLSKNHQQIGRIKWECDFDDIFLIAGSGRISGDVAAVDLITSTAKKAISEKWQTNFPISSIITDPLTDEEQFLTLFFAMDWDIPDVLQERMDNITGNMDDHDGVFICY